MKKRSRYLNQVNKFNIAKNGTSNILLPDLKQKGYIISPGQFCTKNILPLLESCKNHQTNPKHELFYNSPLGLIEIVNMKEYSHHSTLRTWEPCQITGSEQMEQIMTRYDSAFWIKRERSIKNIFVTTGEIGIQTINWRRSL